MSPEQPTNGELLIHLQYIRTAVDGVLKEQQSQRADLSSVQGDVKVLQERTPKQAGGWGAVTGAVGGLLGGFAAAFFGIGKG